jgi:hypothetical protein
LELHIKPLDVALSQVGKSTIMKKYIRFLLLAAIIGSLASCTATYVVRERPAEVYYARPVAPSPNHIWISGDWVWVGGRYEWREGHFERRREGYRWEEGRWQSRNGGWTWSRGHWRAA